jgi:hypothetical protein
MLQRLQLVRHVLSINRSTWIKSSATKWSSSRNRTMPGTAYTFAYSVSATQLLFQMFTANDVQSQVKWKRESIRYKKPQCKEGLKEYAVHFASGELMETSGEYICNLGLYVLKCNKTTVERWTPIWSTPIFQMCSLHFYKPHWSQSSRISNAQEN